MVLPSLTVSVTLMWAIVVGSTLVGSFERITKMRSRGSTSGDWKRSYGRVSGAPPTERGGQQRYPTYGHRASRRLYVRRERRDSSVGASPTRQLSLRPVAIGAVVEVTKRPKPSMYRVTFGDSASAQAATRSER
jgi:hypothetical protein